MAIILIHQNTIIRWSLPMSREVDLTAWLKRNKMKFECWLVLSLLDVVDRSLQQVIINFSFTRLLSYKLCVLNQKFFSLVGPLCLGKHPDTKDRRLDDTYATFKKFNRTLRWNCESGDPAILQITPNTSWPDTVYYNSFTHANMGWKIHIVDSYNKNSVGRYGGIQCIWIGLLFLFII